MQDQHTVNASKFNHFPVMGEEVIKSLKTIPKDLVKDGLIIDATLGGRIV